MTCTFQVKGFAELRSELSKLDKSNDGRISEDEMPGCVKSLDLDGNGTVEVSEFMKAANDNAAAPVFSKAELAAGKGAGALFGAAIDYLKKNGSCKVSKEELKAGRLSVEDYGTSSASQSVSFLAFLHENPRLGNDLPAFLEIVDLIFCKARCTIAYIFGPITSLLNIGATNDDLRDVFLSERICGNYHAIPKLVDLAKKAGLDNSAIPLFVKAVCKRFSLPRAGLVPGRVFLEKLIKEEALFNDPAVFNELRQLGFSDHQIVGFFLREDTLKEVDIGLLRSILSSGLSAQNVSDHLWSVGSLSSGLLELSQAASASGLKWLEVENFLRGQGRVYSDKLSSLAKVISAFSSEYGMKPADISSFILDRENSYTDAHTADIVRQCSAGGWSGYEVGDLLLMQSNLVRSMKSSEALDISGALLELLRGDSSKGELAKYGPFRCSLDLIPHLRGKLGSGSMAEYLLGLLGYAVLRKDSSAVTRIASEARAIKTDHAALKIVANLAGQSEVAFSDVAGTRFYMVRVVNGITMILGKESPPKILIIPGTAKFSKDGVTVEYFNLRNFDAVFEYPPENIAVSDSLLEAAEVLPGEFFNTYDSKGRLKVIFGQRNDPEAFGWYGGNEVVVDLSHGASLSTIVHELAHHWDLNLTIGFDGKQNSAGDASLPFYGISWVGGKMRQQPGAAGPDPDDFAREYGMKNQREDLATMVEGYVAEGRALRARARTQMARGNFELAVKYLFVKHMTPFRGREYDLGGDDKPLTLEEVDAAAGAAKDKSATGPSAFEVLSEIKSKVAVGDKS